MKTVLITGSEGYIGSRLLGYLEDRGLRCLGCDPGFFRDSVFSAPSSAVPLWSDVRDLTESDLRRVDAVIHLAGISNDPFGRLSPEKVYDPTRLYTRALAEKCKRTGRRLIFASSCSLYGVGGGELIDEDSKPNPQSPYAVNKLQIEDDLRELADATFQPIILRFATVFGLSPRIRFDVVINMLCGMAVARGSIQLNSDGKAWRPHVHIDDVCSAIEASLRVELSGDEPLILNIGDTAQNFDILTVVEQIRELCPGTTLEFLSAAASSPGTELVRDRKVTDGHDARTYRVRFDRVLEQLPGFRCHTSVARGMASMIELFRERSLSVDEFNDPAYYRLQKMEELWTSGKLGAEMAWR